MNPQKYVSGGIVFSLIFIFLLLIDWVLIPIIIYAGETRDHGNLFLFFFSDPAGDIQPPYNGLNLAIVFILAIIPTLIILRFEK